MTRAGTTSSGFTNADTDKLRRAIFAIPFRPFLVTLERSSGSRPRLTAHVARETVKTAIGMSPYLLKRNLARQISALGLAVSTRVKLHSRSVLEGPRSLEAFVTRFGAGERLYD